MDSSDVNKSLYRLFSNYEYKLNNSYIYNWESDFFAQSKSGYFIEVEVKISRGDYFRDFDKPKHKLFKECIEGRTHHIHSWKSRGDMVCEYKNGELMTTYGPNARIHYRGKGDGWAWDYEAADYIVNDYGNVSIRWSNEQIYAAATNITFREMANIHIPNQLYFAVPEGLVKLEEIPRYAGLIYITDCATMIKRAPYLHKRKQNLNKVLLDKYYNLWKYKVNYLDQVKANEQMRLH